MEWEGIRGRVMRNVSMRRYTSMKVGGPVPYLVYPEDEKDLVRTLDWFRGQGIGVRFLGNGTNVIVADRGIDAGLVRITRMNHMRFNSTATGALVEAGGGLSLKRLIKGCHSRGLSGLEKLYGIPGTVGGAVRMNAGSFGVSMDRCLKSVRVVDHGGARTIERENLQFGYRKSPFRSIECIVEAPFEMTTGDPARIKADMDYVWHQRMEKHPMDLPSAGSVFKNREGTPCWKYVDEAGLRGATVGGACISSKHANFIVNMGHARGTDIKGLIDRVKKDVLETSGVLLEEEVELWGFDE